MQTPQPLTKVLRYLRQLDAGGLPDGQLLRQFVHQGDEEAFAQLVRRHGGLVQGVCKRILRHHQDAEDAAQAAFVVLARKAGSVSWEQSAAGWLHEVAVRVALEARGVIARRRGRELGMEPLPDKPSVKPTTQGDISEMLDQELSRLSDKYRAPLVLCYLEGRTRDEAAEQLGWTLSQVKSRLEKGRELLRCRLLRRGLTLGAVLSSALLVGGAESAFSAGLVQSTLDLTNGQLATAPALKIATSVLNAMWLAKVKKVAVILLTVLTLSLGIGIKAHQGLSNPDQEQKQAQSLNQKGTPKEDLLKINQKPILTMEHGDMVREVVFTPEGKRLAICSFDGTFRLWELETGKEVFQWKVPGKNSAVAISRDGKRIAGGNAEGELMIWDAGTGKELTERLTRQGNIYSLAFAPDGLHLVTGNHIGTISLWDSRTGMNLRHISAHEERVWSVVFAPDGKTLASAGEDSQIRLWNPETGKEIRRLEGHQNHVSCVAFNSNGTKLVSADMEDTLRAGPIPPGLSDTICVWDLEKGKKLLSIKTPLTHSVAFSPDGKLLVSANRFGEIYLWDATTGKQVESIKGHESPVMCVQFDPTGRRVASSGVDGKVHLWVLEKSK